MDIERVVHGAVLMLRCRACGATFPHFLFSGENDTETAGLCSLSRCNQNEVFIDEATAAEWNDFEGAGRKAFEKRMRHEFGISNLKVIQLLRVEEIDTSVPGHSFQEFRKSYKRPILWYSCACCSGEADQIQELSIAEFRASGGEISSIHLSIVPD